MLVTEFKDISKQKKFICIDYEITFALYVGECKKYNIKLNEEISNDIYIEIIDGILLKRAKMRSMNLLKSKDYTEYQLKEKLRRNYYPETVIDKAVEYIKSYGYIDDLRYSEGFIKYSGDKKSKKQIELLLKQKGISKEIIETAFENCKELYGEPDEEELIKKILLKKKYNLKDVTVKEQQKIIAFLYRKGFSLEKIYKVVGQSG